MSDLFTQVFEKSFRDDQLRNHVVKELLDTERTYVQQLRLVVAVCCTKVSTHAVLY